MSDEKKKTTKKEEKELSAEELAKIAGGIDVIEGTVECEYKGYAGGEVTKKA
jgi:bacteriocin-like protein